MFRFGNLNWDLITCELLLQSPEPSQEERNNGGDVEEPGHLPRTVSGRYKNPNVDEINSFGIEQRPSQPLASAEAWVFYLFSGSGRIKEFVWASTYSEACKCLFSIRNGLKQALIKFWDYKNLIWITCKPDFKHFICLIMHVQHILPSILTSAKACRNGTNHCQP